MGRHHGQTNIAEADRRRYLGGGGNGLIEVKWQ